MIERRLGKNPKTGASIPAKSSPLPADFLKMVKEVFTTNFDEGLKALHKLNPNPEFRIAGDIYADEVVLAVTLGHKDQMIATTVYASSDFDASASSPTVQDILGACVDAAGAIFGQLLLDKDPAKIQQLSESSLSAFENIPFEWAPVDVEKFQIWLRVDKANPDLDQMADEWLSKNDPELKDLAEEEAKQMEELFVTGPAKDGSKRGGSGSNFH